MSNLSLPPPTRIAIGTVKGPSGPLELFLSAEWARYFSSLNTTANTTAARSVTSVTEITEITQAAADESGRPDLVAREAMQAVDELRNEVASLRSDNRALMLRIEQMDGAREFPTDDRMRLRVQQIEDRLQ